VDGFESAPVWLKAMVEGGYRFAQSRCAWVYEALYGVNKIPALAGLTALIVSFGVKASLRARLLGDRPDTIVIFHFMLVRPILELLEEFSIPARVVVVVTDPYTAHPIWFLRKEPEFAVFSDEVRQKAVSRGVAPDRIHIFPFVLDEAFPARKVEADVFALRKCYDLRPEGKVILLLGGGDGLPRGGRLLAGLLRRFTGLQIIVVCGRNAAFKRQADRLKERSRLDRLHVYGFVSFVPDLIRVADVVVTKGGASSIMEILLANRIPVIHSYLWEQEKGNVDFVCRNRMGIYERRPRRLFGWIEELLSNPECYNHYQRNIRQASLRNGVNEISQFLRSGLAVA
jgi:processive 1,2-diacylglycerol beta-glucosyltransferase/1,2-diacylglycerol 3-beta-galactosyltransferase